MPYIIKTTARGYYPDSERIVRVMPWPFGHCENCGKPTQLDCHCCGECAKDSQSEKGRKRIARRRRKHGWRRCA